MDTTRNKYAVSSAALAALVGVILFLVSFSSASAYTLRARVLPAGFSVGNPSTSSGSSSNGGASTGNGGNGGSAAPGGLVRSGNVVSNANAVNSLNTTIVRIGR